MTLPTVTQDTIDSVDIDTELFVRAMTRRNPVLMDGMMRMAREAQAQGLSIEDAVLVGAATCYAMLEKQSDMDADEREVAPWE